MATNIILLLEDWNKFYICFYKPGLSKIYSEDEFMIGVAKNEGLVEFVTKLGKNYTTNLCSSCPHAAVYFCFCSKIHFDECDDHLLPINFIFFV